MEATEALDLEAEAAAAETRETAEALETEATEALDLETEALETERAEEAEALDLEATERTEALEEEAAAFLASETIH